MTGVVAAIIAGGQGTRLGGRRKTDIRIGGRTILERQLSVLRPLFPRILLVANDPGLPYPPDIHLVSDLRPAEGPLAGIEAALSALTAEENAVICVAGDMPLLVGPALALLAGWAPDADAVLPEVKGHLEPLFARYAKSCGPAITAALSAGRRKTTGFLADVRSEILPEGILRTVDPDLRSLENVNTEDDLDRLDRLATLVPPML